MQPEMIVGVSPPLEMPSFSGDQPLVEVRRGGLVERVHRGSIAVADTAGALVTGRGNAWEPAFLRSAAKPFQAMAAVLTGGLERFSLTDRELAVMCASHSGEPRHTEAVVAILHKSGLDESALQCGTHPPIDAKVAAERWRRGLEPTPACNNCSGAHAGMLVACVAAGWSVDGYEQADHPLQHQIRSLIRAFSGAGEGEMEEATDNCAVPTFRLPLIRTATAFARLATGIGVDPELGRAAAAIRRAMTTYPEMVGGEHRFDSDVMRVARTELISKGGADGFQGVGLARIGSGLALKISDGDGVAAVTATMRALGDLQAFDQEQRGELAEYMRPAVVDLRGHTVGNVMPMFRLAIDL